MQLHAGEGSEQRENSAAGGVFQTLNLPALSVRPGSSIVVLWADAAAPTRGLL